MTETLHVVTYNIHKGFSQFRQRMAVHELREQLRTMGADLVFLQEVQGLHSEHALRHENWPAVPQHEFLADAVWKEFAYGRNAVYEHGHHGNAILSKFPITFWENEDVSMHASESRGLLHCEIQVPGWSEPLHCVNVHLALIARWRKRQMMRLFDRINELVPANAPLIIAGDFNDWHQRAGRSFAGKLKVQEVFEATQRRPARSFPALLPVLRLDRIYVRGFQVRLAHAHHGRQWSRISDHAPLSAILSPQ